MGAVGIRGQREGWDSVGMERGCGDSVGRWEYGGGWRWECWGRCGDMGTEGVRGDKWGGEDCTGVGWGGGNVGTERGWRGEMGTWGNCGDMGTGGTLWGYGDGGDMGTA